MDIASKYLVINITLVLYINYVFNLFEIIESIECNHWGFHYILLNYDNIYTSKNKIVLWF